MSTRSTRRGNLSRPGAADGRSSNEIRHVLRTSIAAALGRGFGAHNLRHSFASTYYAQTKDLYGLQKLLGHSSVSITAGTYVHGRVDYDKVLEVVEF